VLRCPDRPAPRPALSPSGNPAARALRPRRAVRVHQIAPPVPETSGPAATSAGGRSEPAVPAVPTNAPRNPPGALPGATAGNPAFTQRQTGPLLPRASLPCWAAGPRRFLSGAPPHPPFRVARPCLLQRRGQANVPASRRSVPPRPALRPVPCAIRQGRFPAPLPANPPFPCARPRAPVPRAPLQGRAGRPRRLPRPHRARPRPAPALPPARHPPPPAADEPPGGASRAPPSAIPRKKAAPALRVRAMSVPRRQATPQVRPLPAASQAIHPQPAPDRPASLPESQGLAGSPSRSSIWRPSRASASASRRSETAPPATSAARPTSRAIWPRASSAASAAIPPRNCAR
jgi:hypothetical protein